MNDSTVVVLGGGGGIGRMATAGLTQTDDAAHIVVADLSAEAAAFTVSELGDPRLRAEQIDVTSPAALAGLLHGAAVVVNCVGPFYRFGPLVLESAINAGVDLVDVCDDLDATQNMLEMDAAARDAGIRAVIGMGNSPGLANVCVRMCADWFLDTVSGVRICHIHGGEPDEGPAVLKHRIHAMTSDVPVFTGGTFKSVRMLESSGLEYVHEEDFTGVGSFPVFPYPHPETITLPTVFPDLTEAANFGVVFPLSYFSLTRELVAAGMADEAPLTTASGVTVAPIDVMVALLRKRRPDLLAEAGIGGPAGCLKVVVTGTKDGAEHTYIASVYSDVEGAGAGTGIPAALGAILCLRGELADRPGVHPPEAIVPVSPLLELAGSVIAGLGVAGGQGLPLRLQHICPDGSVEDIPFALGAR